MVVYVPKSYFNLTGTENRYQLQYSRCGAKLSSHGQVFDVLFFVFVKISSKMAYSM
jgi:hypothetical protein